jgi:phasin family protein
VSKSKNTPNKAAPVAAEFIFGADAITSGLEKSARIYESVGEFNKSTVEAYIESATVAGTGFQAIAQESSSYAKQAIEEAVAASKALMSTRSINEAIALQTNFAKNAFTSYVNQLSRFNEAFVETAKKSSAPLQAQAEAASELFQGLRA